MPCSAKAAEARRVSSAVPAKPILAIVMAISGLCYVAQAAGGGIGSRRNFWPDRPGSLPSRGSICPGSLIITFEYGRATERVSLFRIAVARQDLRRAAEATAERFIERHALELPSVQTTLCIELPYGGPAEFLVAPHEMPDQRKPAALPGRDRGNGSGRDRANLFHCDARLCQPAGHRHRVAVRGQERLLLHVGLLLVRCHDVFPG